MFDNADSVEERLHVEEEAKHFRKVLQTFSLYKTSALMANNRRRKDYHALTERHKNLIPNYLNHLNTIDRAIVKNYAVVKQIMSNGQMFSDGKDSSVLHAHANEQTEDIQDEITEYDFDKLRSTIKQFVRDWSIEGKPERDVTYQPLLQELLDYYEEVPLSERAKINVLIPGAGLGRLAFDIAKSGFSCQGNEFSFYMLLAAHFILNRIERIHQYEIYPFIHSFSNIPSFEEQLKPISIPDVLPSEIPQGIDFSMVAGDFVEIYGDDSHKGTWNCVITCFFIDTAKNIMEYIEIIYNILKPGGLWINIGPLLYHYENMPGEMSIELSLEEVKNLVRKIGFDIKKEKMIQTTYTANPNGMLKYVYDCAFWTCVK
ncbi:132_t:CDS:10 [Paraglomus occultum]|uniref:carnosine N-methyltransferase n=1 Tax=Paraglomus occultum TaxID=144539 RepID=A0A9N9AV76_9GLOM|nr:132_t:CDS:10 [Paraglomus occultum]